MSFDLTDLHTLIVRAHDRHHIPIGKVMRVTLQAAANGKFPLYKNDGSRFKLRAADREWLRDHAAIAEQQSEIRWWTKGPWPKLRAVLVPESKFWEWLNGDLGAPKTAGAVSPSAKSTKRRRDKRDRAQLAIAALWPHGVPDQSNLGNGALCTAVTDWLKKESARRKLPYVPIGDDTILRAAGRRLARMAH
jgi:hypothetical protein